MQCTRAGQQCNFPNSQLQKQGCWVTQPCLSQQVSNSPPTAWKSSQWPIKRVKSLAQPTDSTRQREMPSLKCKWGVLQAGSTELAELFLSHLLGGTSRSSSRWERQMCGVSMGFHLLLHKQKLLQCYILHHSQVAKESLNPFLQITPEPQEPSPETSLFEPDCPISPRALQTFVHWGVVIPLVSLSFHLLYTCLMQIHRNKLFLFSCLQESLISVHSLFPITPATHHWRQEHRNCRKKNIYLHP